MLLFASLKLCFSPNETAQAGLRAGDVVLEIDRKPVRNADEAVKLSKNITENVLLRVWSKGGSRYLVVDNTKRRK